MSINLVKGQKIDLTKTNPSVKKYTLGLGWKPNTTSTGGSFDLDVSVFILNESDKLLSDKHFVFYNNLKSPEEFIIHNGDNRNGEGEGDDESIVIDFSKVPTGAKSVVVVVTIDEAASKGQNFGQVSNSYARVLNGDTNEEILKYDLGEDYSVETALTFCKFYLHGGEWKYEAVGTGFAGGLQEYINKYN